MLSMPAIADVVSISYSPLAKVKGDSEEFDDLINGDDYSNFSLEADDALSIKWSYELEKPDDLEIDDEMYNPLFVYVDYSRFDTKEGNGEIHSGKYQSLTTGFGFLINHKISDYVSSYFNGGAGVGVARFELSTDKARAAGEVSLEGGLSLLRKVYIGVGGKYQIVGYPSETMATTYNLYFGLGVRY